MQVCLTMYDLLGAPGTKALTVCLQQLYSSSFDLQQHFDFPVHSIFNGSVKPIS